ncbi:MAG: aminotransferase class V-fold PLP-dependent enzyme, partial [Marmoricola sp.]
RGLIPLPLAVDADGVLDLEAFERQLATSPPAAVHLVQVAAHRGLVQPVAEAIALCRTHGIPIWVDAAQALGHRDAATGADAVYATSRKWLAGPRGVGMLTVAAPYRDALLVRRRAKFPDLPTVRYLESEEAHVAGRVGLAVAVREYLDLGPELVAARLDEVGRLGREVLGELAGWEVVGSDSASGATTALRATSGQDVVASRSRLLGEQRILTTACLPWRAPREMSEPLLRVSPHVDCTVADLQRLRTALAAG